jgi:hypothetical protein
MENINIKVEAKFWNEIGKWCVAVFLPVEYDCWSESCWDKKREKAQEKVMKLVKKHLDFIREFKKLAETREEILIY